MTPNDQIKMKVLQGLRNHMDGLMGAKLKERMHPKAISVEKVTVEKPEDGTSEAMPEQAMHQPSLEVPGMAPAADGMADEDKKRLLDLYSSLK